MPELPDVETFRRYLETHALGEHIAAVRVSAPRILAGVTAPQLDRRLKGKAIEGARRHGKILFARADGAWIVFRFGMTGFLRYYRDAADAAAHERAIFDFRSGAHLALDCQRMFGRVGLARDPDAFVREHDLGPDARAIDAAEFGDRVGRHRGAIKGALMDQSTLAGIGNVYADEVLFQARLHPRAPVASIDERALASLHRVMARVLERAIEAEADPARMPRGWLIPARARGGRCPRCGTALETLTAGGRTTYVCPRCQAPP